MENNIRHDFINNGLRIEVLNKLITEAIESNQKVNPEYLEDLHRFLQDHVELINQIKE
jgi:hypothetical protein